MMDKEETTLSSSEAELAQAQTLEQLTRLLEKCIKIFEEDRKLATDNYNNFCEQLEAIKADFQMSDGGAIEAATNNALDKVIKTGYRLEKVLQIVSTITLQIMRQESQERIAKIVTGGGGNNAITHTVDIKQLMDSQKR